MSQTKTVEQWLQELPEPYRSQALEEARKDGSLRSTQAKTLRQAVDGSFRWKDSPQGWKYWSDISASLGDRPLPDPPKED